MKKWIFWSFGILGLLGAGFAFLHDFNMRDYTILSDDYIKIDNPALYLKAKELPTTGFLQAHGSIHRLKVSDNFILKLYPLLQAQLPQDEKKCLQPSPLSSGGHITLVGLHVPKEQLEAVYSFNIIGLFREVRVKKFYFFSVREVWYELVVNSPALLKTFKQISNRDILHISIGVTKKIEGTDYCFYR
jgi:hypothetical protein